MLQPSKHSYLGGGRHGHLGLIIKESLYATLSETLFIVPQDPGSLPVFNPNQIYTAAARYAVVREHKEMRRIYKTATMMI